MKIFIALIMAISLSAEPLYLQDDKQKHFIGSFAIASVCSGLAKYYGSSPFEAWFIGFGSSIIIGLAKEKIDGRGYGTEDINDVYADALGASIGATLFSWEF